MSLLSEMRHKIAIAQNYIRTAGRRSQVPSIWCLAAVARLDSGQGSLPMLDPSLDTVYSPRQPRHQFMMQRKIWIFMLCDAGAAAAAERAPAPAIVTSSYWNDAELWHPGTSTLGTHHSHLPDSPVICSIYLMYISTVNSWHNNKHNLSLVISVQYCGIQLSIWCMYRIGYEFNCEFFMHMMGQRSQMRHNTTLE